MAPKTVFLHAHDGSWHSRPVCHLLDSARRAPDTVGFLNLNNAYPKRCLSPRNVFGPSVDHKVRNFYYHNWGLWTNTTPPARITFECCAQFVASRSSLHKRELFVWARIMRSIVHDRLGNNWEYLWPTLVDESMAERMGTCR